MHYSELLSLDLRSRPVGLFSPFKGCHKLATCQYQHREGGTHTLTAHRALSLCRLLLNPFHDTVLHKVSRTNALGRNGWANHVKVVATFARYYKPISHVKSLDTPGTVLVLTQAAIIAWVLARGTRAIKVNLADAANVIL